MNRIIFYIFVIFFSTLCVAENWRTQESGFDAKQVYIEFMTKDGFSFSSIFDNLPDGLSVKAIHICCILSATTNSEIASFYKEQIPDQFKNALNSSANLHNPELLPLSIKFEQAFKSTRLYLGIEKELVNRGYTINEFWPEKFMLFSKKEPFDFHADIWINIVKND